MREVGLAKLRGSQSLTKGRKRLPSASALFQAL